MPRMKRLQGKLAQFKASRAFPYFLDGCLFCLTFLITFLCYVIIFGSLGFYPIKEDGLTTMMLDQRDQYVAYMRAYQNILKSGGNIVYTLGKVFGGDFQSIFTYYLSSPFNFFLLFVSSADIPAFFFYTSVVKMSFAAGNTYLLARYMFKRRRIGYLAFAVAYGLISYAFVYFSNFMYLDGLMILPLVTLGLEALKKEKHYFVYPLALAYALFSNWYIGFMLCVYAVLFFFSTLAFMKGGVKGRLSYALRFFLFSLAGGLLSASVWLSAYCHFDGTKATSKLPEGAIFNWASFFEGLLENNYLGRSAISRNNGYMTMFVSVVSLSFALLYFTCKGYSWREKSKDGLLFLCYFIVSLSSVLNALFHGGREPTWFPARYSFIIGFYLCYLSLKETDKLEETPLWGIALPGLAAAILLPLLCFVQQNALSKSGNNIYYPLSVLSLLLYIASICVTEAYLLFHHFKKTDPSPLLNRCRHLAESALLCLTIISSCRGAIAVNKANVKDSSYLSYSTYRKDEELTPVFDAVKSYDSSLYRMESTFNRSGSSNTIDNNPLFYGYSGLSHYSSTEKKEIATYMKRLGFHKNGFWERYDAGSTEAMNAFLGVKYLIDDGSSSLEKPQFIYNSSPLNLFKKENIASYEGYAYYKNEFALPLGFAVTSSSNAFVSQGEKRNGENYWYGHFDYQNRMYRVMSDRVKNEEGKSKDIFKKIEVAEKRLNGAKEVKEDSFGQKTYSLAPGSSITFSFTVPIEAKDNILYICEKNLASDLAYKLDDKTIGLGNYWNSGIHSFLAEVGSVHTFTVSLPYGKSEREEEIVPEVYYEDLGVLREYLSDIASQGTYDLCLKNGLWSASYEGSFELKQEGGEFLFTLPYESDFSVYLDGEKKETMTRFDIFTAISLEGEAKGTHTIKIVYVDKGMMSGGAISIMSLGGMVPLLLFYPRLERKLFKKGNEGSLI
jgi:uncharacterized membrane protein YfhO